MNVKTTKKKTRQAINFTHEKKKKTRYGKIKNKKNPQNTIYNK